MQKTCFQAVTLSCILYICTYFVFYKSLPTPLCPTVPLSERCLIVNKNPFVVNAYLDWCHHLSEENGLVCMQILFLFFFLVSAQLQHFEDLPLSEGAELEDVCTLEFWTSGTGRRPDYGPCLIQYFWTPDIKCIFSCYCKWDHLYACP